MKVLIVGGYGVFGGRLVRLLADAAGLEILVAGRSADKAAQFIAGRAAKARLVPWTFDRDGDLAAQLAAAAPELVIDASGPFQGYGAAPWRLVQACLEAKICYLDLADASDFVAGVDGFDPAARAAGVFALSGVSSFPVLTAAAVRRLTQDWRVVTRVEAGVAPSPHAGVGLNVIRAIASYAGRPLAVLRGGQVRTAHGLTEGRRRIVAVPGGLPLPSLRFLLVDTPDLTLLRRLWPQLQEVWVGAAMRPQVLQAGLNALAWLARWRLVPRLTFLAPLFHWAINRLAWGEHRGGMFVTAQGLDADGAPVTRTWAMLAEADDGPMTPVIAAAAIVRRMLAGGFPQPGARPALDEVQLEDFEAAFAQLAIQTGISAPAPADAPLYPRLLGAAWADTPAAIRAVHDTAGGLTVAGRGSVERGGSPLAKLICALFGFPQTAADTPVSVTFSEEDGRELWLRRFSGRPYRSTQEAGRGRDAGLVVERFGPLAFAMAVVVKGGRLDLVLRGWRAFGVPMPLWLGPKSTAGEYVEAGRFHFHVEISHPLTGLIVRYRGWLAP